MNYNRTSKRCGRNSNSSGAIFDLADHQEQIEKLTSESSDPNFWKDPSVAQNKLALKSRFEKEIKRWNEIETRFEETSVMLQLSEEEADASLEKEIEANLQRLKSEIDQFTIETLLSGEKDFNNAIVTLHPGPGEPNLKTGRRCSCGCMSAGPSGKGIGSKFSTCSREKRPESKASPFP